MSQAESLNENPKATQSEKWRKNDMGSTLDLDDVAATSETARSELEELRLTNHTALLEQVRDALESCVKGDCVLGCEKAEAALAALNSAGTLNE